MKKSIFTKMGAAAMVLTLVTASLVGGTFAKYTSTVSGTGTAQVAEWKIAFSQDGTAQSADYNFNLASADTTNVASDRIVPGDKGVVLLKVNGDGSEVAYDYTVTLDKTNLGDLKDNFDFYTDNTYVTPLTEMTQTKNVALADVGTEQEVKLYWKLADDADALAGKVGTFKVTMTATQKTATTP